MGWNRQNITDWMAMAGAVSSLVYIFMHKVFEIFVDTVLPSKRNAQISEGFKLA